MDRWQQIFDKADAVRDQIDAARSKDVLASLILVAAVGVMTFVGLFGMFFWEVCHRPHGLCN